jgi:hypothetical protein
VLKEAVEQEIPMVISYLSRGKWHVAKVIPVEVGANRFEVELAPGKKAHPINIRLEQPVGLSLKYHHGKIMFDTAVTGLEPSPDPLGRGRIVLMMPDRVEVIERRSFFRVDVPVNMKVNVVIWRQQSVQTADKPSNSCYHKGQLVDISAGGVQVAIDSDQKGALNTGQFVGIRFTPMPYERPILFDAQIRNVLPTADGKKACLGMQIVGLETSSEGRRTLDRLCDVVEKYYKMNQTAGEKQGVDVRENIRSD